MINRNSVIAACTPVTVVSKSSVMSLIITFMFEPAKLQMNWASASAPGTCDARGLTPPMPDFRSTGPPLPGRRVREDANAPAAPDMGRGPWNGSAGRSAIARS